MFLWTGCESGHSPPPPEDGTTSSAATTAESSPTGSGAKTPGGSGGADSTGDSGASSDGDDGSGGSTSGGEAGHPDGLDPWLPDLDASECPVEYSITPVFDDAWLEQRTVCPAGCDHTTVGEAVAAAQPNEEILLAPGDYAECVDITVSPLSIRGDDGLARFVDAPCDPGGAVISINAANVRLSSLEISGYEGRGVGVGQDVEQLLIERVWFEDLHYAVNGAPEELILRQVKVKNVGSYNESIEHQEAVFPVNPSALVVDRSVFSHFKERAWLMGLHEVPHIEFVCSVVAKVLGDEHEADHSFHVFFPTEILLTNNYFQEFGRIVHYMYNFDGPPAAVTMRGNDFVFDNVDGDFVGVIQPNSVVSAVDNRIVGGVGDEPLSGFSVGEVSGNTALPDRDAAGLDPYPAVPNDWPISQL